MDVFFFALFTLGETLINSSFPRKRESRVLILLGSRLRGNDDYAMNQRFLGFLLLPVLRRAVNLYIEKP